MPLEQHDGYKDGRDFAEDAMKALENTPLDLSNPVPLSFFLYLPDQDSAKRIGEQLVSEGYEIEDIDESAEEDGRWLCWSHLSVVPTLDSLEPIGAKFLKLAEDYGGEFDGWETNPYKMQGGLQDMMAQMLEHLKQDNPDSEQNG